ncbi:MAG: hypothetical protein FWF54_00520 [Candidatus Azobacteroides sp.]|nr:hypothetical protein [Candidatus Azobacteroides sp.]
MDKKMKIMKCLLLSFVLLLTIQSCNQNTNKNQSLSTINDVEDKGVDVLKVFYQEYISACCNLPESYDVLDRVKKKYLSDNLYKRLEVADLDYDPFLNSQDCNENWLKTLDIKLVYNENNIYKICYNNGDNEICIILSLINNDGNFIINDIKNADLLTIGSESEEENKGTDSSYNIKGNWFITCNESAVFKIEKENDILLPVMSNQIYIKARIEKVKDNFYHVYLIEPDDLGAGGLRLDWDNFSTEKPIADIEILSNGTMSFKWIGFYHISDKKIVFPECEFNLETGGNPSILINCP